MEVSSWGACPRGSGGVAGRAWSNQSALQKSRSNGTLSDISYNRFILGDSHLTESICHIATLGVSEAPCQATAGPGGAGLNRDRRVAAV